MSGLCGLVAFDREPRGHDLHGMLLMLSHRGIGDPGVWMGRRVALGWWDRPTAEPERRTDQPLRAHSPELVLVFDGRLDNREELLAGPSAGLKDSWNSCVPPPSLTLPLEGGGVGGGEFAPVLGPCGTGPAHGGDAEIVLDLYARLGPEAFGALLGDFALALWDGGSGTLHLARSPLGVRPLFWCATRDRLVFASEAKAILTVDGVPRELDESSLRREAHTRYRDPSETFFKGIRRVVPGTRIEVRGGSVSVFPIWRPEVTRRIVQSDSRVYQEAFVRIIREAVRCRLPARGSAAILLSGGIDSAAVTLLAGEVRRGEPRASRAEAYTWVSDVLPEERAAAREAARRARVPQVEIGIDHLDPLAELEERVFELESPFVDPECNWFRALMREAAQRGATVLLSGLWGDETMLCHAYPADLLSSRRWSAAWRELNAMVPGEFPSLWAGLEYTLMTLLRPDRRALRFRTRAQRELHERVCGAHSVSRLEEWERASAWAGLDLRVPFLDLRLLDYLLAVPAEERAGGKRLLREAMAAGVPEEDAGPKAGAAIYREFLIERFRETAVTGRTAGKTFEHWDRTTLRLFRQAFGP